MINIDITEEEVKKFKNLLDYLKRLSEDGVTPLIEKQLLLHLEHSLPFFSHLTMVSTFPEIKRLTINRKVMEKGKNQRIKDINLLKYPPKDKVERYGRCNLLNQPVLYAGFDEIVILSELRPKLGDLITQSTWRLKQNQTITYCPIFKNQPTEKDVRNSETWEINQLYEEKLKYHPPYLKEQIDCLVQFIADSFTKFVHPDNHRNYIFSAFFASKILTDFENGTIEAIYYPSVQSKLTFQNIAIKPSVFNAKYELIEVKDSVVIMEPEKGRAGYYMHALCDCKSFDYASNKILWEHGRSQPEDEVQKLISRYKIDLSDK